MRLADEDVELFGETKKKQENYAWQQEKTQQQQNIRESRRLNGQTKVIKSEWKSEIRYKTSLDHHHRQQVSRRSFFIVSCRRRLKEDDDINIWILRLTKNGQRENEPSKKESGEIFLHFAAAACLP